MLHPELNKDHGRTEHVQNIIPQKSRTSNINNFKVQSKPQGAIQVNGTATIVHNQQVTINRVSHTIHEETNQLPRGGETVNDGWQIVTTKKKGKGINNTTTNASNGKIDHQRVNKINNSIYEKGNAQKLKTKNHQGVVVVTHNETDQVENMDLLAYANAQQNYNNFSKTEHKHTRLDKEKKSKKKKKSNFQDLARTIGKIKQDKDMWSADAKEEISELDPTPIQIQGSKNQLLPRKKKKLTSRAFIPLDVSLENEKQMGQNNYSTLPPLLW